MAKTQKDYTALQIAQLEDHVSDKDKKEYSVLTLKDTASDKGLHMNISRESADTIRVFSEQGMHANPTAHSMLVATIRLFKARVAYVVISQDDTNSNLYTSDVYIVEKEADEEGTSEYFALRCKPSEAFPLSILTRTPILAKKEMLTDVNDS